MRKRKETTEDVLETTDHNKDRIVDYAPIQFLSFDISTKKIISGNGKKRVPTSTLKVKYYPCDAVIFKRVLTYLGL